MKRLWYGFVLLGALATTSCASNYYSRMNSVHQAYYRGQYDKALEQIGKIPPSPRDRLVYLLDKGMILQGAGRYKESNQVLTEAEELSDLLSIKSASRETAATFWNEEAREYPGDRHERVLIPVIRMINHLLLDDWQGTLIEARRTIYLIEKIYGGIQSCDNPFALYLSAIVWEAMGQANDALIDYRQLSQKKESVPYYGHDLKAIMQRLDLHGPLPPPESLAWTATPDYRREKGELVVIAQIGKAPLFFSETISTGYFSVAVPSLRTFPSTTFFAKVSVDQRELGRTYSFYRTLDDALKALKQRRKTSFKRQMAKVSVQSGLYAASHKLLDDDSAEARLTGLGLGLLAISMAATEKADERSWRTLPGELQIGRFYLPPGRHEVIVTPEGGSQRPLVATLEVRPGKPSILLANFTGGSTTSRVVMQEVPEQIRKLKGEERQLTSDAAKNHGDGDTKIRLARARIALGNYNVEPLLAEGMEQGGDRSEGTQLMVLTRTLLGKIGSARAWAEKGIALNVKGSDFSLYKQALDFLAGAEKSDPSPTIPLNDKPDLTNATHHYLVGLSHEKKKEFSEAVKRFASAYGYGLIGSEVQDKIMATLDKTDQKFKKSAEGLEIYDKFADVYLEIH